MPNSGETGLLVLLLGFSALFLLAAARAWSKLALDREGPSEVPKIRVHQLRSAANMTALAFYGLVGAAIWFCLITLSAD